MFENKKLMAEEQLAERLDVHKKTIREWRLYRGLPYLKAGRRVFIHWDDFETWARDNAQEEIEDANKYAR